MIKTFRHFIFWTKVIFSPHTNHHILLLDFGSKGHRQPWNEAGATGTPDQERPSEFEPNIF